MNHNIYLVIGLVGLLLGGFGTVFLVNSGKYYQRSGDVMYGIFDDGGNYRINTNLDTSSEVTTVSVSYSVTVEDPRENIDNFAYLYQAELKHGDEVVTFDSYSNQTTFEIKSTGKLLMSKVTVKLQFVEGIEFKNGGEELVNPKIFTETIRIRQYEGIGYMLPISMILAGLVIAIISSRAWYKAP